MTYTYKSSTHDFQVIEGNPDCFKKGNVIKIFDPKILNFFSVLSKNIFKHPNVNNFPDIVTFAFFCRKASLSKLANDYNDGLLRLGWGNSVHITPSNVPVNTAFSFLFSLLAGNVTLIKIPSQFFLQLDIFFIALTKTLEDSNFKSINDSICFIQSNHESIFLYEALTNSDYRIIWGGDETVTKIRSIPSKANAMELAFPDRSSFCILDTESVNALNNKELTLLCDKFYNDTLLVDQNACSSPSIIFWHNSNNNDISKIQNRFWLEVQEAEIRNGPLGVKKYIDKSVSIAKIIQNNTDKKLSITEYGLGTTVQNSSTDNIDLNNNFSLGRYEQYDISDIQLVSKFISRKTQTITYYGISPKIVSEMVLENDIRGVDRIVPIGEALNMKLTWDGKDIIRALSRIIKTT